MTSDKSVAMILLEFEACRDESCKPMTPSNHTDAERYCRRGLNTYIERTSFRYTKAILIVAFLQRLTASQVRSMTMNSVSLGLSINCSIPGCVCCVEGEGRLIPIQVTPYS